MRRAILMCVVLFLSKGLQAQSVEQLIQEASTHNPGLRALQLDYLAAKEQANQVSDFPDPTIGLGVGVMPVETRLGAQRFRIGITQPIPWKGLLAMRKELKGAQAEIFSFQDEIKEIDIAYGIRVAYSALWYTEDRLAVLEDKIEIVKSAVDIAKSNQSSGRGTLSDILLAQRSLEELESNLSIINVQKLQPTIMINRWTGNQLENDIQLVERVAVPSTVALLDSTALYEHPYFQMIESRIQASQKAIDLTKLESKPKLGIGVEYAMIDTRNNAPDLVANGRDVVMPMGSLTIPLHTDRYDSKRQEERIKQQSLSSQKQEQMDQFQADMMIAFSQREVATLEIEKYRKLRDRTDQTVDLLIKNYAAETVRFEELLRLVNESIDYNLSIAKSEYDIAVAAATILKYQFINNN